MISPMSLAVMSSHGKPTRKRGFPWLLSDDREALQEPTNVGRMGAASSSVLFTDH